MPIDKFFNEVGFLEMHLKNYNPQISKRTGMSINRYEMKSLAVILLGQIEYIEIPREASCFFDGCWNVMNYQHETEKSCSYC